LALPQKGGTTICSSTTITIFFDGPRENRPNRKAQVCNRYVSEPKKEILVQKGNQATLAPVHTHHREQAKARDGMEPNRLFGVYTWRNGASSR
jgi:hypothetical protein